MFVVWKQEKSHSEKTKPLTLTMIGENNIIDDIYKIIMLTRIARGLTRSFCVNKPVQQSTGSSVIESQKADEVPVYLRPYDKSKYEVPMHKIKLNSGYAFLEVEPFPRAKIMKSCYHILEQLSIGFPQTCIYRIFNEERTKYLMKVVDETTDVEELEDFLGVQTIEIFLDNLVGQFQIINIMRHSKIWELQNDDNYDPTYMAGVARPEEPKSPAYKKPERAKTSFVEE